MLLRPFAYVPVGLLILALCGCGTDMQPVTGVVTMDGKPLPSVNVIFYPTEGGRANSVGSTDEAGHYSLNYTRSDVGAMVGHYKVLVSKTKLTEEGEKETLPLKYNQKTTFKAEVTSTGDNVFNYDLESK